MYWKQVWNKSQTYFDGRFNSGAFFIYLTVRPSTDGKRAPLTAINLQAAGSPQQAPPTYIAKMWKLIKFIKNVIFWRNHTDINPHDWTITKKTIRTTIHENFSKMKNSKVDRWALSLSREWRCSWSGADRRCSNYIWVINNFIAYQGAPYTRGLTVYDATYYSQNNVIPKTDICHRNYREFRIHAKDCSITVKYEMHIEGFSTDPPWQFQPHTLIHTSHIKASRFREILCHMFVRSSYSVSLLSLWYYIYLFDILLFITSLAYSFT